MRLLRKSGALIASTAFLWLALAGARSGIGKSSPNPTSIVEGEGPAVLWRNPVDITSRNLYYGPGGTADEPRPPFTFTKEIPMGSTPKFEVIDANGVKWTVKMGEEARPETAASRLVWAAGYFADENYYAAVLPVQKLDHLHRGERFVTNDDTVHGVRLKRRTDGREELGSWSWEKDPFVHTREWYGLQVLMALINNWDLKDINNSVFQIRGTHPEQHYVITDLGASFGTSGFNNKEKGKLKDYKRSKWVAQISAESIDFNVPSIPALPIFFNLPEFFHRTSLLWLGRNVPIADARWMGNLLGRLSPEQIRDAFRGSGYSAEEIDGYSRILEARIALLRRL